MFFIKLKSAFYCGYLYFTTGIDLKLLKFLINFYQNNRDFLYSIRSVGKSLRKRNIVQILYMSSKIKCQK